MGEQPIVVETRDLVKVYGDGSEVHALDGVNMTVRWGEFAAIVGPSGSGKSTLLNMIGALDRPTRGEVIIGGTPLTKVRDLDRFRSQTVGFIFQTHNLIPTLTARENVEVPMYESAGGAGKRRARAASLLELVGLGDRLNALPNQLSGGQRQRVAIARALANNPAIVLADEPTGNLDSKTTAEILELLCDLNRGQGTTLIVVTHNPQVAREARRVVTIRDGLIQRDVAITNCFATDLLDWKTSGLGQAILQGQNVPEELQGVASQLKDLLEKV
ncbi:MAG: ABC transporter ATP-binding protein [Dehalococcoidales bacterium]|nr:ABC transporter ATP-binding protein [Dehalococcoidales bacterium]